MKRTGALRETRGRARKARKHARHNGKRVARRDARHNGDRAALEGAPHRDGHPLPSLKWGDRTRRGAAWSDAEELATTTTLRE